MDTRLAQLSPFWHLVSNGVSFRLIEESNYADKFLNYCKMLPARFGISEKEADFFLSDFLLLDKLEELQTYIEPHKAATWLLNHPEQRKEEISKILEKLNLQKWNLSSKEEISKACQETISEETELIQKYRDGKNVLGVLISKIRKRLPKTDPKEIKMILSSIL